MSPSRRTNRRRVWLIQWVGVGQHARPEQEVAAMLPWQAGAETVRRFVEAFYAAASYTPAEMLEAARPRGHNPYKAHFGSAPVILEDGSRSSIAWDGEVLCGANPHLVARQAYVWVQEADDSVAWEYLPRPEGDLRQLNALLRERAPLEPGDA